jgi:hypothetical protein
MSEMQGGSIKDTCALARRALVAAYDPDLKQAIQTDIDRLCPNPPN